MLSNNLSINDDALELVLNFISSQQLDIGGFRGRSPEDDLYYTFFAVSILVVMGGLFNRAALVRYLDSFDDGADIDFIHLACLIRCRVIIGNDNDELVSKQLEILEEYRSDDGGYQQSGKHSETGSVYACFIAWLIYSDTGQNMPNKDGVISCLRSFKLADGSYVNNISVKSGSTTVTAAAILLLHELGLPVDGDTISQLLSRAVVTGGFLACDSAPIPDLLSTATALYALRKIENEVGGGLEVHHDYVASLWNEDGGFAGNVLDGESDCEYTYYALLALG